MMKSKYYLFLFLLPLFIISCEEDFTPYVKGDTSYMFFCALDSRFETQYAYINRSCFYGNTKSMPENLKIVLSENRGKNYIFRDTVLNGMEDYACFYLKDLKIKHGTNYRFTVMADSLETQYGELTYFPKVSARFVDTLIKDPYYRVRDTDTLLMGYKDRNIFAVYLNKAEGFFGDSRLYIEYELKYGAKVVTGRKEIPSRLRNRGNARAINYREGDIMEYWTFNYSEVSASYQSKFHSKGAYNNIQIQLYRDYDEILYALKYINPHAVKESSPNPDEIIIKRAYLVFIYLDKNVYFFARPGADYSIRLDESYYYSNLFTDNGQGHGLVGINGADTLDFKLKQEWLDKFGYKNGQK